MTTKHGTTSPVTESKGLNLDKFQKEAEELIALIKNKKRWGMMDWRERVIKQLERLRDLIGAVGLSGGVSSNAYPVVVNYERSVEDGVKAGKYKIGDSHITSENFPTKRKGTAEVVVELIHFNREFSTTEKVLCELDRMGYRPAELPELLAFGEKYPEAQCNVPIVALGSVWQDEDGTHYAPYLYADRSPGGRVVRFLALACIEKDWKVKKTARFAVVRK